MSIGILAVLDDIAALLDDAAAMTKVAAKKTVGVLGDDLAVGAEQGSQFRATRELPVIWAIAKGSFKNKLIILPIAFLLSYFAPYMIIIMLIIGGTYLAYEGTEKVLEYFHKKKSENCEDSCEEVSEEEALKIETEKVKGAILTDFILSIEIIVIALGTVVEQPFEIQVLVVSTIALMATVGVYGIVALLIRLDDIGFWLIKNNIKLIGEGMVRSLPYIIRALGVIGMLAMLLVAGGIYSHNIHFIHDFIDSLMPLILGELILGLIIGLITALLVKAYIKIKEFLYKNKI